MNLFGELWGWLWANMVWVLGAVAIWNWPWHL